MKSMNVLVFTTTTTAPSIEEWNDAVEGSGHSMQWSKLPPRDKPAIEKYPVLFFFII